MLASIFKPFNAKYYLRVWNIAFSRMKVRSNIEEDTNLRVLVLDTLWRGNLKGDSTYSRRA